jgi:hypothetical protein
VSAELRQAYWRIVRDLPSYRLKQNLWIPTTSLLLDSSISKKKDEHANELPILALF